MDAESRSTTASWRLSAGYYHPFELAKYAVTDTGHQVLQNALQWQRPL